MQKIKTDSSIPFETQKKNKYFFDRKLKKTILCHPLFYFLLKLKKEGIEPVDWVNQLQEDRVQIEGYGIFTREEVAYYLEKFLILKENGYFGELPREDRLNARMTPEKVNPGLREIDCLIGRRHICQCECPQVRRPGATVYL